MNNSVQPVFIFSLPRCGSTLLQRLLCNNDYTYAVGEMWLLLKVLGICNDSHDLSLYWSDSARRGLKYFFEQSGCSYHNYLGAVKGFVTNVYKCSMKGDQTFFVDKTPRYALVVDEIIKAFPQAKFIFLWREPLSMINSITGTWSQKGALNINTFKVDYKLALPKLIEAHQRISKRSISVRYEDLVLEPSYYLKELYDYVGIPFSEKVIEGLSDIKFGTGDPTGQLKYKHISKHSLKNKTKHINNEYRKLVVSNILRSIPKEYFDYMGYSKDHALQNVKNIVFGLKGILGDLDLGLRQAVKLYIYKKMCGDGYCYRKLGDDWYRFS